MTVPVQTPFNSSVANGATTTFPYGFKITAAEDVKVQVDGDVVTSGYTVTGVGNDAGGSVVFAVAPANGAKVVRYLMPVLKRVTDYQQFGDWMAAIVNNEFDRIWLALQTQQQNDVRAIKLPVDTAVDQLIAQDADARAGKALVFDEDGNVTLSQDNYDDQAANAAVSASASATSASGAAGSATAAASSATNAATSATNAAASATSAAGSATSAAASAASVLGQFAASSGSSLIGHIASGAGAVATTVQAKLRRTAAAIQDFDTPNNALAGGGAVTNKSTLASSVTLDVPAGVEIASTGDVAVTCSVAAGNGVSLNPWSVLRGGHYVFDAGVGVGLLSGDGAMMAGARLEDTSASNAICVNIAASNIGYARLIGNYISGKSYGVLTNSAGDNIHGISIAGNVLISSDGDALEINAPGKSHTSLAVTGNVLASQNNGAGVSSGFAIGLARARGVAIVGNAIEISRQESIHIEDEQHTNVVVGNAALDCLQEGILVGTTASGLGEGLPVVGNNFRADATNTTFAGASAVYDANLPYLGMTFVGNRFNNFYRGIEGNPADILAVGNVINSASDCALKAIGGGRFHGLNLSINSATLAKSTQAAVFGKIVSTSLPTTLLDTSAHSANTLGSILKGFSFPKTGQAMGAGTTTIDLCKLPLRMKGLLTLTARSAGGPAEHVLFAADVLYDGTTLTVSNSIKKTYGIMDTSGAGFVVNGSNLACSLYLVSGTRTVDLYVDFEGVYYA